MTDDIYAYTWGLLFLLIFSNIAVWLYVAFTKLTQIENYLASCNLVQFNRRIWGGGPLGRMYRLMQISGILFSPSSVIKNGEADLREIMGLPVSLRRWVKIPFGTGAALFVAMVILYVYGKYFLD